MNERAFSVKGNRIFPVFSAANSVLVASKFNRSFFPPRVISVSFEPEPRAACEATMSRYRRAHYRVIEATAGLRRRTFKYACEYTAGEIDRYNKTAVFPRAFRPYESFHHRDGAFALLCTTRREPLSSLTPFRGSGGHHSVVSNAPRQINR